MGFLSDSEAEGPSFATFAKISFAEIIGVAPHHVKFDSETIHGMPVHRAPSGHWLPIFRRLEVRA
jgi:hypothetical protein